MRERLVPPSSISSGALLAGCRIAREIGRGGMGIVYLAEHRTLQRTVAIKVLPALDDGSQQENLGSKQVVRFLNEARAASRIEHPNVITIHDAGSDNGVHYIVMQYVDGRNLAQLLELHGEPIPWWVAAKIIRAAAQGLHAVHRKGLIHRDIKPSNIMLSSEGRVLVMDFGLVRGEVEHGMTSDGLVVGTLAYMSPEQSRGEALDRRSDIFSLGATLYTLVTGQRPFSGSVQEIFARISQGQRPPSVQELIPKIPMGFARVLERAMSPRREDRFDTAEALARALSTELKRAPEKAADGTSPIATRTPLSSHNRLPELELVALESESRFESLWVDQTFRGWFVGGVIVVGLLLLSLVLNLSIGWSRGQRPTDDNVHSTPAPARDATPKSTTNAAIASNTANEGMVLIPAGNVQTGNPPQQLRDFLRRFYSQTDSLEKVVGYLQIESVQTKAVSAFWIDAYEVSNADYEKFVAARQWPPPSHWKGTTPPAGQELQPVVNIRHADALAFAKWAGKELPTLEQWLRAYRGQTDFLFPWGNEYDPRRANVGDNPEFPSASSVMNTPRDVSRYMVFNLVGNVGEYLRETTLRDERRFAVVKGGDFGAKGYRYGIACGQVFLPAEASDQTIGFRCVREIR